MKRDRSLLESELRSAGAVGVERKSLRCPFHDDKNPSAGIRSTDKGFWYFHCYVCDINEDVFGLRARVSGRNVAEVLKEANPIQRQERPAAKVESFATIEDLIAAYRAKNPNNKIEEINPYTNPETGDADLYTLRIVPHNDPRKTFRQVSKHSTGWQWTGLKGKLPIFNRLRVNQCSRVLVVEGEKCVREITKLGIENLAATTSPGGAQAGDKADWSPLAGKSVYVWRDNDEPGQKYEADVISALVKLDPPCSVYRVRVEELELDPKQDVVDYLGDASMTNADKVASLNLVLFDAEALNVTSALEKKFERIASGEFRSIAFPQKPVLSDNSKAVLPGCLTTVCGEPGAGKSFLMIEDFWRWSVQFGERVKLLMLEDDDAFHQGRALAQMSGHAELLDPDFVADNGSFAQSVLAEFRDNLEKFSRNMETAAGQMTLTEIANWVINHAENGVRIIGVDPITAAKASDKPWIEDQQFLFAVKPVLERTGASLILTTHPRMGQAGKPSLSGMAGGAAYPRFSQCVLWLQCLNKPQESRVWDGYLNRTVSHKQILQIRKARNGKGQGQDLAVNLNFQNLCFDEYGSILREGE